MSKIIFEERSCPLCEGQEFQALDLELPAEAVGHNVLCDRCGLIYHNPVMTAESMSNFYKEDYAEDYHASKEIVEQMASERIEVLR